MKVILGGNGKGYVKGSAPCATAQRKKKLLVAQKMNT